ncbi:hypothetical protein SPRG_09062 [Saprolegnia parasitica CBS 223.65]|uniref:Purple acid phosphatase n=1 Tax=Saprolegnia parasitica (strain CBS 223.65) TaxID=695850 RepID=A0A067C9E0_SAPPC|nr:hypothetical protein SPRG_09062 [Saprolegnia parasitica CBS 223.65]KDO25765.1 hypothetical protein SPRG_09062 [Saprolegnia parasitica CBS 223.65]|eukprot:XP_012203571.1 hypothetical protein SPRG_09062 [Saprolegnia parasitica CBS 223.65]
MVLSSSLRTLLFSGLALQSIVAAPSVSQVHLGISGACIGGISLSFASSESKPLTVKVGDQTVKTVASTYSVGSYTSPYLHTASFCNLASGKAYTYSVGSFQATFTAPLKSGEDKTATVLGILGDMDYADGSTRSFLTPYNGHVTQAILVAGDWSYANGKHPKWDKWFDLQSKIFSQLPVTGINGNHETTQSGEAYTAYLRRMPGPISGDAMAALRTYYSLDIGLVHAIFLDDYVGSTHKTGGTNWRRERDLQLEWLQNDLGRVDRTKTPYVIVVKHNPFYNSYDDHQCMCGSTRFEIDDVAACWGGNYKSAKSEPHCGLQAKLEDVYAQYKVNVVFAGHVHGYERTKPVLKNQVDTQNGIVYVTTGAGGRGHAGSRIDSIPNWSAFAEGDVYGASRLIATREKMQVLWFSDDDTTTPLDSFEVSP